MLKVVIFDFNGVIVNDEPLHFEAFRRTLEKHGVVLTKEAYFQKYFGFDDKECLATNLKDHGKPAGDELVRQLTEEKTKHYREFIQGGVELFPGVKELLPRLAQMYPLAINSGALLHEIEHVLHAHHLRSCIQVIVSADEIKRGKPHPEGYLAALAHLQARSSTLQDLKAAECLVIEDAPQGIQAAKQAGMRCLAVTNSRPREALGEADHIMDSLEGLDEVVLQEICERN